MSLWKVDRTAGMLLALAAMMALFSVLLFRGVAQAQGEAPTTPMPCVDGMAGPYPCEGIDFLSLMTRQEMGAGPDEMAANLWGWTDPDTGKKYVAQGTTARTSFIDVSDPANPVFLGDLPTPTIAATTYRDMKVYGNYLLVVSDVPSEAGLQVFDLTKLRNVPNPPVTFAHDAHWDGLGNGHNVFVNEETGYAYITRMTEPTLCNGAMLMVNIQDPLNPSLAGCYDEGGFSSDTYCVLYSGPDPDYQGSEICFLASDNDILVADVTDKSNPETLATLTYPDIMRAHLLWLTEDQQYGVSSDMNDEMMLGLNTRLFGWDFTDLDNPQLTGIYTGPTVASDHNVWIKGNRAYVGNFRAGLRVLDITDVANGNMTEAAYFDMVPGDDNTGHHGGAWAAYVYFEDGLLAVTDTHEGLYLLQEQPSDPTAVTLDGLTPISNAPSWLLVAGAALAGLTTLWAVARNRQRG